MPNSQLASLISDRVTRRGSQKLKNRKVPAAGSKVTPASFCISVTSATNAIGSKITDRPC